MAYQQIRFDLDVKETNELGTPPRTRADYTRQAEQAIKRHADLLGVSGEWRFIFRFADAEDDEDLRGCVGSVSYNNVYREALIRFKPRLKPEYYSVIACHEVLHVFFDNISEGIHVLAEPARTVMWDILHARLDKLAEVIAGPRPTGGEELDKQPPWECV